MTGCIFCGKTEIEATEKHHVVPKCINKDSKEQITLCQTCHKKVHKYLISDLVSIILDFKKVYNDMNEILKNNGMLILKNVSLTDCHNKLVDILIKNIPTTFQDDDEIYIKKLVVELKLSPNPKNCQRIGFILRDLGIVTKRKSQGVCVVYNNLNLDRLKKIKRAIQNQKSDDFLTT